MDMHIDLGGNWEEFAKTCPERFLEAVAVALKGSVKYLEDEVKLKMPVGVTKDLRNSVVGEVQANQGIVGTPSSYAEPVEFGAKPHMPPVESLVLWVKRKLGITDDKDARDVAWGIATMIKRHGTMRYTTKEPGAFAEAFAKKDEAIEKFDWAMSKFVEGH